MAIKNIIAKGIGFVPATVKWIVTHGFSTPPPPQYQFGEFEVGKSTLDQLCAGVSGLVCHNFGKSKLSESEINGMALTTEESTFDQGTTATLTATLLDESGSAIASSSLDTLTLTLYDRRTGLIINSRDAQDVLDTNNVTVHATSGLVTWAIQAADNAIVGRNIPDGDVENHVALFRWTYNTSANAGLDEIPIRVRNVRKVS